MATFKKHTKRKYGLGGDIGKGLSLVGKTMNALGAINGGEGIAGLFKKNQATPQPNTTALDAYANDLSNRAQSNIPTFQGTLAPSPTFAFGGNMLGMIGSAAGDVSNTLISNGYESNGGGIINGLGDIASNIPGPWGAVASAGLKTISGLTNRAFGQKVDNALLTKAKSQTNALNNYNSAATSFDSISGPQSVSNVGEVYKGGWFSKGAAEKKNQKLQNERAEALGRANRNLNNNINNISNNQMNDLASRFSAYGGFLRTPQRYYYHALGGGMSTQGVDWSNGATQINEGGMHEENPYGGVPMGMSQDGAMNLVEEGEVVYDDYVYSDRMEPSEELRKQLKLPKGATFADAAKKAEKEIKERPNDPISNRGFKHILELLKEDQEAQRLEMMQEQQMQEQQMAEEQQMLDDMQMAEGQQLPEMMQGYEDQPMEEDLYQTPELMSEYNDDSGMPISEEQMLAEEQALPEEEQGIRMFSEGGEKNTNIPYPLRHLTSDKKYLTERLRQLKKEKRNSRLLLRGIKSPAKSPLEINKRRLKRIEHANKKNQIGLIHDVRNSIAESTRGKLEYPEEPFREMANEIDPNELKKYFLLIGPEERARRNLDRWKRNALTDFMETVRNKTDYPEEPRTIEERAKEDLAKMNYYASADLAKTLKGKLEFPKEPRTLEERAKRDLAKMNRDAYNNFAETVRDKLDYPTGQFDVMSRGLDPKDLHKYIRFNKDYTSTKSGSAAKATEGNTKATENKPYQTWSRYAPIVGSALSFAGSFIPPDYSNADRLIGLADTYDSTGRASYKPIGDYMTYKPTDINYLANQLRATERANARSHMNLSNGNSGTARASLLANMYKSQNAIGKAYMEAELANRTHRKDVAEFNRTTNDTNSTNALEADKANVKIRQENNTAKVGAAIEAAKMRQAIDNRIYTSRSNALSNIFQSLGDIGNENFVLNAVNSDKSGNYGLIHDGVLKKINSPAATTNNTTTTPQAYGGYLTTNKRKTKRKK